MVQIGRCPLLIAVFLQGLQAAVGQETSYDRSLDSILDTAANLTAEDKINIRLAETVGVSQIGVTYPWGESCTLKKEEMEEPIRVCRNITIPSCKTVQKIKLRNITEDCTKQTEYCQYNFRTMETTKQTILCSRSQEQECEGFCDNCGEHCFDNNIVTCNTVAQTVAVTEKKQRCGPDNSLQTTKICFTYPDASWVCREQEEPRECDRSSVRLVAHEETMPRIECQQSTGPPLCIPRNCRLKGNETDCVSADLPEQLEVKDEICEQCKHGRRKLRTVLVQEKECHNEVEEHVCTQIVKKRKKWRKYCSEPPEDGGDTEQETTTESRVIKLQLPGNNDDFRGADIFFANQLFKDRKSNGDRGNFGQNPFLFSKPFSGHGTDGQDDQKEDIPVHQINQGTEHIKNRLVDRIKNLQFRNQEEHDHNQSASTRPRFITRPNPSSSRVNGNDVENESSYGTIGDLNERFNGIFQRTNKPKRYNQNDSKDQNSFNSEQEPTKDDPKQDDFGQNQGQRETVLSGPKNQYSSRNPGNVQNEPHSIAAENNNANVANEDNEIRFGSFQGGQFRNDFGSSQASRPTGQPTQGRPGNGRRRPATTTNYAADNENKEIRFSSGSFPAGGTFVRSSQSSGSQSRSRTTTSRPSFGFNPGRDGENKPDQFGRFDTENLNIDGFVIDGNFESTSDQSNINDNRNNNGQTSSYSEATVNDDHNSQSGNNNNVNIDVNDDSNKSPTINSFRRPSNTYRNNQNFKSTLSGTKANGNDQKSQSTSSNSSNVRFSDRYKYPNIQTQNGRREHGSDSKEFNEEGDEVRDENGSKIDSNARVSEQEGDVNHDIDSFSTLKETGENNRGSVETDGKTGLIGGNQLNIINQGTTENRGNFGPGTSFLESLLGGVRVDPESDNQTRNIPIVINGAGSNINIKDQRSESTAQNSQDIRSNVPNSQNSNDQNSAAHESTNNRESHDNLDENIRNDIPTYSNSNSNKATETSSNSNSSDNIGYEQNSDTNNNNESRKREQNGDTILENDDRGNKGTDQNIRAVIDDESLVNTGSNTDNNNMLESIQNKTTGESKVDANKEGEEEGNKTDEQNKEMESIDNRDTSNKKEKEVNDNRDTPNNKEREVNDNRDTPNNNEKEGNDNKDTSNNNEEEGNDNRDTSNKKEKEVNDNRDTPDNKDSILREGEENVDENEIIEIDERYRAPKSEEELLGADCDEIFNLKQRIRCRVINCFRETNYCF